MLDKKVVRSEINSHSRYMTQCHHQKWNKIIPEAPVTTSFLVCTAQL